MAGTIMPGPWFTGLDDNGDPVVGGKLYTYAAGTSTPLATYQDVNLSVPHSNPIILDGGGRVSAYLSLTSYKFVLKDANDVTIRTQDEIGANVPLFPDTDIDGIAGETGGILQFSVCYLSQGLGYDQTGTNPCVAGQWYLADADFDFASSLADVLGVSQVPITQGFTGSFRINGRSRVRPLPITVGKDYYVSPTPGEVVTPPPAVQHRIIGIADTPNTLVLAMSLAGRIFVGDVLVDGDLRVIGNVTVDGTTTFNGEPTFVTNVNIGQSANICQNIQFTCGPENIIYRNTADGADTGAIRLAGGGALGTNRGANVIVAGNEHPSYPGSVLLATNSSIQFFGSAGTVIGLMYASGGFGWGTGATDPGANNVSINGVLTATGGLGATPLPVSVLTHAGGYPGGPLTKYLRADGTFDIPAGTGGMPNVHATSHYVGGSDPLVGALSLTTLQTSGTITAGGVIRRSVDGGILQIAGGSAAAVGNGAVINLHGGSEGSAPGRLDLVTGFQPAASINFYTFNATLRGVMHQNGGFSWGNAVDPGANNISVVGTVSAAGFPVTSDARLKTDLAIPLTTDILSRLVVHDFQWKEGGTVGRGLFAQEAIAVLPSAVTVGCEGPVVDEPWGVDYGKVVPDLVVGWQQHDRVIQTLLDRIAALEAKLE